MSLENLDFPNALEHKINTLVDDRSETNSNVSHISSRSLVPSSEARKLALQYLRPSRSTTESSKEFIKNSRKILMKAIAIQDKREETKRLAEFIQMEQKL